MFPFKIHPWLPVYDFFLNSV